MTGQEGSLGELEEPNLGNAGNQREIEVLQAFLVGKSGGFESLAQLLLMSLSQFPFEQPLQVAQISQPSLLGFPGCRLTIACHAVQVQLLEIGGYHFLTKVFRHGCTSSKRL